MILEPLFGLSLVLNASLNLQDRAAATGEQDSQIEWAAAAADRRHYSVELALRERGGSRGVDGAAGQARHAALLGHAAGATPQAQVPRRQRLG